MLEDGLSILGNIGTNAQNLELLLKYLDRLVPFVGAGLSFDFGYPSWSGLLKALADRACLRPQIDSLLAEYQFEEAAEILAALPNLLDDALRNTFDHDKLPKPLGKGAVRHLVGIVHGPVITTNFDGVLEAVFKEGKTYVGFLSGAFGVLNNFLHIFMPLAPSLRLRSAVVLIIAGVIGVGITAAIVKGKGASISGAWTAWVAGSWGGAGLIGWALYSPLLILLENHSRTQIGSQLFDSLQTGAYVFPFFCWSIALTALATVFL